MTSLEIEYPCEWRYRLIGRSAEGVRAAVEAAVGERPHRLEPGHESRGGRYVSLTLTMTVESEAARLAIYHRLSEADAVRMVL